MKMPKLRPLYYDINCKPMKMLQWAKAFEKNRWRVHTELYRGIIVVSTVWLGLDHSFGQGKPLIFESMVFCKFCNGLEADMERYHSKRTAQRHHAAMVKKWKNPVYLAYHIVRQHLLHR